MRINYFILTSYNSDTQRMQKYLFVYIWTKLNTDMFYCVVVFTFTFMKDLK